MGYRTRDFPVCSIVLPPETSIEIFSSGHASNCRQILAQKFKLQCLKLYANVDTEIISDGKPGRVQAQKLQVMDTPQAVFR
jgi:hypothetical protein